MSNDFPFEALYSIQSVLLLPFVSVGLMLFALGFYVLLFGMVVYFLCTREAMVRRKLHLGWLIALFILSVSSAALEAGDTVTRAVFGFLAASTGEVGPLVNWVTTGEVSSSVPGDFATLLYLAANCIADTVLLHRCFLVWGSIWHPLTGVLLLILFGTNILGLVIVVVLIASQSQKRFDLYVNAANLSLGYAIANAANTLLLTFTIAARIWWMTRDIREYMGHNIDRKYKRIVFMLIESGFLYSAVLIANVGFGQSSSDLGFLINLNPLVRLMVGIAPTLIFLRTSLAANDNAVPEIRMLSTLRFGEPPTVATSESETRENRSDVFRRASIDGSKDAEAQKVEHSETSSA